MSTSPARPSSEYILGTGADELDRLALQARLWSDAAHNLWRMARIQPGSHVLDVGCGPGYAAFDLAQLVTRRGRVIGLDESANFVAYANGNSAATELLDEEIRNDPGIYPDEATMKRLFTNTAYDERAQRTLTRLWTRVKTGR